MTTLAIMKARIASELRRTDLTTQIADAITTSIEAYKGHRFWFAVSRALTFTTVAGQEFYTATDNANIGRIEKIDFVNLLVGTYPYLLSESDPDQIESLSLDGTQDGQPRYYSLYANQFRLYPIPEQAYTVRVSGIIGLGAPASDVEANNAWMIEGERLIRHRATFELATHVLRDKDIQESAALGVEDALTSLRLRSANRQASRGWRVTPVAF